MQIKLLTVLELMDANSNKTMINSFDGKDV